MEKYIFLDSNIYISAGYSFGGPHMKKFSEFVSNDGLILLQCSACIGEVENHIKTDLKNAATALNKAVNKKEFAALRNDISYKEKLKEIDWEDASDKIIESFHNFLKQNHAKMFSLQGIDVEGIMQDYFEKKPPFETKKPNEFKDAIMIKALKNYQKELNEKVIVITNDNGYRQAFRDDDNFVVYENLVEFLRDKQRTNIIYKGFDKYFHHELVQEQILDKLDDLLQEITFNFYEREEFQILNIESGEIKYDFNYAEIDSGGSAKVFLTAYFCVTINCKYLDVDNSYYDKENDEYIVKSYIESKEVHCFKHEVVLDCKCKIINREDYIKLDKERYEVIDKEEYDLIDGEQEDYELSYIDFDADTYGMSVDLSEDKTFCGCINSRKVMPEKEYSWFEKHVVKCSECGKILGFNDSDNYHDYEGEPLCDECAVTNENGFICPGCGFKHPYKRMGNSGTFCIDCEEEYDN